MAGSSGRDRMASNRKASSLGGSSGGAGGDAKGGGSKGSQGPMASSVASGGGGSESLGDSAAPGSNVTRVSGSRTNDSSTGGGTASQMGGSTTDAGQNTATDNYGNPVIGDAQGVADVRTAQTYLDSGGSTEFQEISSSGVQVTIDTTASDTTYSLSVDEKGAVTGATIYWNPRGGLEVEDGIQSPALGLQHESGHVLEAIRNPNKAAYYQQDTSGWSVAAQGRFQERYEKYEIQNIQHHESPVGRALGEPLRQKFTGRPVTVSDVRYHCSGSECR